MILCAKIYLKYTPSDVLEYEKIFSLKLRNKIIKNGTLFGVNTDVLKNTTPLSSNFKIKSTSLQKSVQKKT